MNNVNFSEDFEDMFIYENKLSKLVDVKVIENYKKTYYFLVREIQAGNLSIDENYCCDNELAQKIYEKKYFLRGLKGNLIETKPEHVFVRVAAFCACIELSKEKREEIAKQYYLDFFESNYLPGGRVLAGAGDLYRLKTLANCFVSTIERDDLESIYKTAYEAARTFSYGGGIGVDVSQLRPRGAEVHNAATSSTGAVSFMDLFSVTTGIIGQSGRRGALMLTIDVKHPDVLEFIEAKRTSNWVTKQVLQNAECSQIYEGFQLEHMKRNIVENTQLRFANISVKVNDEFLNAVEEQNKFGKDKILVYLKQDKYGCVEGRSSDDYNYSYGISDKNISEYKLVEVFNTVKELNIYLRENNVAEITEENLLDVKFRDFYGDYVVASKNCDLVIRYSGDFLVYYKSKVVGEIKKLYKARDIWNKFIECNYRSAEPGIIFWSNMKKYSAVNTLGRPIACTNPCGEVPLEDGGACNLGSINLSKVIENGFSPNAKINWNLIKRCSQNLVRLLDSVVFWNEKLNPLQKQREAAKQTREIGIGVMGIADFFYQLGLDYDSQEAIDLIGKVLNFIAQETYKASAMLAKEKGQALCFDFDKYKRNPFYIEVLDEESKKLIKKYGLRNVGITSIAPNNGLANIASSFQLGSRKYFGVSNGIEPVFALFYTRRAETMDNNRVFKIFHSSVQAYIDLYGLTEKVETIFNNDLKGVLPTFFFKTAHYINKEMRVKIQGKAQKYIDHSITSTVNLPEDISPEEISDIYLKAWKEGLKGITIYRDGSRNPILAVDNSGSDFSRFAKKKFRVKDGIDEINVYGDEVLLEKNGKLTTVYHMVNSKKKN